MPVRVAVPDMVSPSYFPAIAAVELGFFDEAGIDATVELVFPVTEAYRRLRDGEIAFVAGAAHAALSVFDAWQGCKLLCALSQNTYWFLVVRSDLDAAPGDLDAVRGLRIGAAPGPVDALRRILDVAGIDPDSEVDIGPVPGSLGPAVSFGVQAAKALADGTIDGFWANGMAAEIALRDGTGTLLLDARRDSDPRDAAGYTFPALVTTDDRIRANLEEVTGAVRAVVMAQRALQRDPALAVPGAGAHFPPLERDLIADLVRRDAPYYDPAIPEAKVETMHRFARDIGVLTGERDPSYRQAVSEECLPLWGAATR
jgi:ABC-type nitrate/sulfonate/bicarbonate transport system substrate-binding protein